MERYWHIGRHNPWRGGDLFPRGIGPFIRAAREKSDPALELVIGQWSLIPWFAKTAKLSYATNNARFEEITSKASFKHSWTQGKRCVIPAVSFDEPNWESGKNVWWRFLRADGAPWGLAGVWKRPSDEQDKRSVVAIEFADVDLWLHGSNEDAQALVKAPVASIIDAAPAAMSAARHP